MKSLISILLLCFAIANSLFAVKATPLPIVITQSDGTVLHYYIQGDEYFSYRTTIDGYLLDYAGNGDLVYASFEGLSIKPSAVVAHNKDVRSLAEIFYINSSFEKIFATSAESMLAKELFVNKVKSVSSRPSKFPKDGSPRSLIILVNYADKAFVVSDPQKAYTDLLNEKDYSENMGTGSARDYFIASSDNKFSPSFDVVGPYDLPNNMHYYGKNNSYGNDQNPRQMVIDACKLADGDINFADYDTDGDGKVDNVFVYYAGHNEAEGASANTVWPHRSVVSNNVSFDGVEIYDYACTSELRMSSGSQMCGIGTFCHEFGHVIGLPDFYVTRGSNTHKTLEKWDVMDAGSYNNDGRTPPTYSSYQRFFLGWLTPEILAEGQHILEPLVFSNKAYLVSANEHNLNGQDPNPVEFFMIENRQRVGWDEKAIPGEGLLVEHIYFNKRTWDDNSPNNDPQKMGVSIVYADGNASNPAGDTYPGSLGVTACRFFSRAGDQVGEPIINIAQINNNISFIYGEGGPNDPFIENVNTLERFVAYKGDTTVTQTLEIKGRKLVSPLTIALKAEEAEFRFRFEGSNEEYVSELVVIPNVVDSTFNRRIEIYCTPKIITYSTVHTAYLNVESDEFTFFYPLSWQAPRPVIVVPPLATEATEVTPYSFVANWNDVIDATAYYVTVYSIKDEKGEQLQDFSDFGTQSFAPWYANFSAVSRSYYSSPPLAVSFSSSTDTLISETYFEPANIVSFWFMSNNATGVLNVEAYNGAEWKSVDNIEVNIGSKNVLKKYDFKSENNYIQFRVVFRKSGDQGMLFFDDFLVQSNRTQSVIIDNDPVFGNNHLISMLDPNVVYFYKVKATDKDFENNLYENITDYSNTISVSTDEGFAKDDKRLTVKRRIDGRYECYAPEFSDSQYISGERLYIYNIQGEKIAEIGVSNNPVLLPELPVGNIYIIKYSPYNGEIKRKDKVTKFFYH